MDRKIQKFEVLKQAQAKAAKTRVPDPCVGRDTQATGKPITAKKEGGLLHRPRARDDFR